MMQIGFGPYYFTVIGHDQLNIQTHQPVYNAYTSCQYIIEPHCLLKFLQILYFFMILKSGIVREYRNILKTGQVNTQLFPDAINKIGHGIIGTKIVKWQNRYDRFVVQLLSKKSILAVGKF